MNFTHLDKILWPQDKITKGDLIEYYRRIAPVMLPYLADRPVALNRFPDGIKKGNFFQKNAADKLPAFVHTRSLKARSTGKKVRYMIADNTDTLLYFGNLAAVEIHPWNSRVGAIEKPDWMIFDLDPGPKVAFGDVVAAAQKLHIVLDKHKLPNFVKTSGKRGLHIYVPAGGRYSYDRVRKAAHGIASELVAALPKLATLEHWPVKRRDKILVDIGRNAAGQTAVAPYGVRPAPGAPVSTPLRWGEVRRGLDPSKLTINTIFKRLKQKGDVWKPLRANKKTPELP